MREYVEVFPDGQTQIDRWFYDTSIKDLEQLGTQYVLTKYNILADGKIYTKEIQELIEKAYENGGGVIVVPPGTYMTGSLFFKQGVHLYVAKGGVLKGSDDVSDYAVGITRIEGETCTYYKALINADGVDGFCMCGPGTIDGNGMRSWKAFWQRRSWNPSCTNKDEQRPRLIYISNSTNVTIADINLINAHFWTTHIYRCDHVRYLNCYIYSPIAPVKAPSTDGIDIDVCTDVLVKNCCIEVNDDAIALKGGKGPWADTAEENGINERILIEDCQFITCPSCITCGSESIHNKNILARRICTNASNSLLCLKMRTDTPQHYEYITVEDAKGSVHNFLDINPWGQFADLKGKKEPLFSIAHHVTLRNCICECEKYWSVKKQEERYVLSDFVFENLNIRAKDRVYNKDAIRNLKENNIQVD